MSRIHKLENIYKEQLEDKDIQNISKFIQSVIDADITKGKYARFLIEAFLNDKFLEEDLIGGLESTVGQAISLFHKHKSKLSENMRSVYALDKETGEALYQSPGDLWNSVKQFQGELSGKELKREEQEKIYRETEFIYKDENTGFQIVSPLTEESAKWWGKGTRWCTSADNNNRFKYYFEQAPLFILLMSTSAGNSGNGNKLQLWKYKNDIQFMDEVDNRVSLQYIEQNWSVLEPICRWLNNMKYIPEQLRTKELCELAIKQNGSSLYYVPECLKTPEFCEVAVKNYGHALQFVPDEIITKELCELAIKQNGNNLAYVPDEYVTKEICKLAVKNNSNALRYVPDEIITQELCELAVQNNDNGLILYPIPEKYKTPELCELAVQQNGISLHYVPKELKTIEMCELAVKENGFALEFVPKELITKELCDIAIRQNINAVKYIPEKYKVYTEIDKLECQQKKKEEVFINTKDKHQETFQEIKILFPIKDVSLDYHHS